MMKVFPLKPSDVSFLQEEGCLYVSDFRAISESMDYEIPAMWKYENILTNIVLNGFVAVNEYWKNSAESFKAILVPTESDPRISVFKRLQNIPIVAPKLWVAIPHPEADAYASQKNLSLNYSYADFLRRNDKFKQKEYFGNMTPKWHRLSNDDELESLQMQKSNNFIKRRFGSGGFTVFPIEKTINNEPFSRLLLDKSNEWFIEDRVDGKSCSIQCLKHAASDEVTIFGFSEQTIVDDSIFIGSKLRSPNDMESLENQFFELIRRIHPVLERYEGFFGIDFVLMDDNTVSASEINVRLTAATVPTLMLNALGKSSAIYLEDVSLNEVSDGDIKLAIDEKAKAADILRIEK